MVREVDSTSPPIPAVLFAKFGSDPPRYCQANPAGIPGGVSGIWPISATVLGSYITQVFGAGGSGLGSQAAEPSPFIPPAPDTPMADHPHTIDRWDDATGENLIEQIAAVGDYLLALETYRAAVKRWPKDKITLRNRARVIEQSWRELTPRPLRAVMVGVADLLVRRKLLLEDPQRG